jgi:hypothetical protein
MEPARIISGDRLRLWSIALQKVIWYKITGRFEFRCCALCLTGVGHGGSTPRIATADAASSVVLKNIIVFGSVNANKRHRYKAGVILARGPLMAGAAHHATGTAGRFCKSPGTTSG